MAAARTRGARWRACPPASRQDLIGERARDSDAGDRRVEAASAVLTTSRECTGTDTSDFPIAKVQESGLGARDLLLGDLSSGDVGFGAVGACPSTRQWCRNDPVRQD